MKRSDRDYLRKEAGEKSKRERTDGERSTGRKANICQFTQK